MNLVLETELGDVVPGQPMPCGDPHRTEFGEGTGPAVDGEPVRVDSATDIRARLDNLDTVSETFQLVSRHQPGDARADHSDPLLPIDGGI